MDSKKCLAVITGGGSGIGQALALCLARRGMQVLIVGRKVDKLERTEAMEDKRGYKGEIDHVQADLTEKKGIVAIAEKVASMCNDGAMCLRLLVHNAGVNTPCKHMMDMGREEWRFVNSVNVEAPLFLTKALLPYFGKDTTTRNRVLFLSSQVRNCKIEAYGPYSITKLSSFGVAKMLALELPKRDTPVYCSTLIPGEVDTKMQKETAFGNNDQFPAKLVKHWQRIQKSGQLLPPEVSGAFMEYVLCDTEPSEYSSNDWMIYDKSHHTKWTQKFPDVEIVEPKGLFD